MMSNCFFWALLLYWRRARKGHRGYLIVRRSRFGRFPHALYGEIDKNGRLRMVSYKPLNPRMKHCPPPLFKGQARWGDL